MTVDVLPAIIDCISGEVGELKIGLDDKETGFNSPAFAINFTEMRPVIFLFVQERSKQDFCFSIWQLNTDEAVFLV